MQNLKFSEDSTNKLDDTPLNGRSKAGTLANANPEDFQNGVDIEELVLQNKQLKKDVQELRQYKIQASQSHIVAQINRDLAKKQELLQGENQDLQEQLMDLQGQLQKIREEFDYLHIDNEKLQASFNSLKQYSHDHEEFLSIKNIAHEASKEIDRLKYLVSQKDSEIENLYII